MGYFVSVVWCALSIIPASQNEDGFTMLCLGIGQAWMISAYIKGNK